MNKIEGDNISWSIKFDLWTAEFNVWFEKKKSWMQEVLKKVIIDFTFNGVSYGTFDSMVV